MRNTWEQYAQLIEKELKARRFSGSPKELYDPINYLLDLGGKRIRPVLCLMAADLFGDNIQKVLPQALAIEVFHNFTLVHDDIMDEAPLRRGKTTVHEKWNRDVAILSGDVMFVKAYELICQADPAILKDLLFLFNKTAIEVCEGQQWDMNFENDPKVNLDDYLNMIELKTAVLLACSLKLGAMVAGASAKEADLIYEFGRNLGIAFQIQDDYLDAYANPDQFGKRVGGDIISNKKTFLLLTARQEANKEQLDKFIDFQVGKLSDEEKVDQTIALFNELKVPELTKASMQDYFEKGMQALKEINRPSEAKKPLIDLARMLMQRQV